MFKDNQLLDRYESIGYITVPFLDKFGVQKLVDLYKSMNIVNNTDCLAVNTVLSDDQNQYINDIIVETVCPILDKLFIDFKLLGGVFSVKEKKHPELPLHQDTTNVDCEKDTLYTIWIPLCDVDQNNGAIFLLPKSHKYFENYISYTLPSSYIERKLIPSKYIKTIKMKAGEAFIFSNKLFHGSYINQFKENRIAVVLTITNKESKLVYYSKKDDFTISKFEINPKDYLNSYKDFSKGGLPTNAKFIEHINYRYLPIDHKAIYKKITGRNYSYLLKIREKFFKLCNGMNGMIKI